MLNAIWNVIFQTGDECKKKYGVDSNEDRLVHLISDRIQRVYDEKNIITEGYLEAPIENDQDRLAAMVKGLKVLKDDEGLRYSIGKFNHFESKAEVLAYVIDEYNHAYNRLADLYDEMIFRAVEESALGLYNKACADFHEAIDKEKPIVRRAFREKLIKESE